MKSSRATLSIVLLLSLPAKIYAADSPERFTNPLYVESYPSPSSGDSVIFQGFSEQFFSEQMNKVWDVTTSPLDKTPVIFYQQQLGNLDEGTVAQKEAMLAEIPTLPHYVAQSTAPDHVWQRIEINGKASFVSIPRDSIHEETDETYWLALKQTEGKMAEVLAALPRSSSDSEPSSSEPSTREVNAHGWVGRTYYNSISNNETERLPVEWSPAPSSIALFTEKQDALHTQQAEVTGKDLVTDDSCMERRERVFKDILTHTVVKRNKDGTYSASQAYLNHYYEAAGITPSAEVTGKDLVTDDSCMERKERVFKDILTHTAVKRNKDGTYSASQAYLNHYYEAAGITPSIEKNGLVNTELNLFKQSTADREVARADDSTLARQKLLSLLRLRENLIQGTPYSRNAGTCAPGLNLLSALAAKTAHRRTQVVAQLRSVAAGLSHAVSTAQKDADRALADSNNNELIFRLNALARAINDEETGDATYIQGILSMLNTAEGFSLGSSPIKALSQTASNVYTSWYTSRGEPEDATKLRAATAEVKRVKGLLAKARTNKNGNAIDAYTKELATAEQTQEVLFAQVQAAIVEPTRQLIATNGKLLGACAQIERLKGELKGLEHTITQEEAGIQETVTSIASMLALLVADEHKEKGTLSSLLGLFDHVETRADLKRSKHTQTGWKLFGATSNSDTVERTAFKVAAKNPDYYFVRDTLAPAVDAALAETQTSAAASSSGSSSSEPTPSSSSSRA